METFPSSDKRWVLVETTMRRHRYQRQALIQTLHTVQQTFGFIDDDAMRFVARKLSVALSQVYGVATFYHFFTLKPPGKHTCVVCTGTACYIKGADKILDNLEADLSVRPGETTADGEVSLLEVRCIGSCGLAPVVILDGQVQGKISAEETSKRVQKWTSGGQNVTG